MCGTECIKDGVERAAAGILWKPAYVQLDSILQVYRGCSNRRWRSAGESNCDCTVYDAVMT